MARPRERGAAQRTPAPRPSHPPGAVARREHHQARKLAQLFEFSDEVVACRDSDIANFILKVEASFTTVHRAVANDVDDVIAVAQLSHQTVEGRRTW